MNNLKSVIVKLRELTEELDEYKGRSISNKKESYEQEKRLIAEDFQCCYKNEESEVCD